MIGIYILTIIDYNIMVRIGGIIPKIALVQVFELIIYPAWLCQQFAIENGHL